MPAREVTVTVLTGDQFRTGSYPCDAACEQLAREDGEMPSHHRAAAVKVGRFIRKRKLSTVSLYIPKYPVPDERKSFVRAWVEGIMTGVYTIRSYKRDETQEASAVQLFLIVEEDTSMDDVKQTAALASVYANAVNYARDLTNLPGNLLTPVILANEAERLAEACGLKIEVLSKEDIAVRGMGGLYAVGQGSVYPPHMITLRYTGDPSSKETLGLVGKGITFDTGGISLKDADGMEEMVSDMGGAAVVMAVMQAISKLKPKCNVVAVIAAAENMPSGTAYRPGDVITSLSGRTIEVRNTDAEGRIVLADAMTYAIQQGATRLIDIATLTGAVLVALGDIATAAITNDNAFLQPLLDAAMESGEYIWELPHYPEYKVKLNSDIADLKNSAGKHAGTILGALFIGEFAEGLPWIHLDTGGTAWLWDENHLEPKGGTGATVRTLLHYIETATQGEG